MINDDGLDGEWSCPICGTVMHVIDGGYQCRGSIQAATTCRRYEEAERS